jgi:hypothetical protein
MLEQYTAHPNIGSNPVKDALKSALAGALVLLASLAQPGYAFDPEPEDLLLAEHPDHQSFTSFFRMQRDIHAGFALFPNKTARCVRHLDATLKHILGWSYQTPDEKIEAMEGFWEYWEDAGAFKNLRNEDLRVCVTDITYSSSDGANYEIIGAHQRLKDKLARYYEKGVLVEDEYRKAVKSADDCVTDHSGELGEKTHLGACLKNKVVYHYLCPIQQAQTGLEGHGAWSTGEEGDVSPDAVAACEEKSAPVIAKGSDEHIRYSTIRSKVCDGYYRHFTQYGKACTDYLDMIYLKSEDASDLAGKLDAWVNHGADGLGLKALLESPADFLEGLARYWHPHDADAVASYRTAVDACLSTDGEAVAVSRCLYNSSINVFRGILAFPAEWEKKKYCKKGRCKLFLGDEIFLGDGS